MILWNLKIVNEIGCKPSAAGSCQIKIVEIIKVIFGKTEYVIK